MTRTTVILDEVLLEEAKQIAGESKTSRVINKALEAFVKRERIKHLLALRGSGIIELGNEEIEELNE